MSDNTKVIGDIKNYIASNNIPIPLTVSAYDTLAKEMNKYSRAWLCNNGIKCAKDILPFLSEHPIDKDSIRYNGYLEYAQTLGLSIRKHDSSSSIGQKSKLWVKCDYCDFEEVITAHSLMRRTKGCKWCTGQSKWDTRESEFLETCTTKNIRLVENSFLKIGKNKSSKVKIICNTCNNIFERTFANIVNVRYPTNCPVCHPPKVYGKMGTEVYYNSIEFNSEFEVDTYKILLEYLSEDEIDIHIPYTEFIADNNCKYISDFLLLKNIVLEVSSFKLHKHPEYAERIYEKESLLQNTGYKFVFCNTLAEVEDLVQSII